MSTEIRKGQAPAPLERGEFALRFRKSFVDPAYRAEDAAIDRLEAIAWDAYRDGRKAPITRKAGPGYVDPDYDLSVEWIEAKERLERAQQAWADPATPTRALVICGSPRNDGTCPGEISKTFRLAGLVREELVQAQIEVDFLDLSHVTSEYGRKIHPCKGCVSTAMPLCHWPCSCYPNHSLDQIHDWMNEIYERWVAAHAIVIVTPTHWYSTSSALKLMIDRLVCADGGNPDPTSTHGKKPDEAKATRARRLGLSEASRAARLRPGGPRRRRRHRGNASGALGLARLDGADRRRRPGPAGSLYRLLRAVRDQP